MSASLSGLQPEPKPEPEKCTESNAMERADGEWCKLEMNKVVLLPRETRELCLGRGPALSAPLLLKDGQTARVQMINLGVA